MNINEVKKIITKPIFPGFTILPLFLSYLTIPIFWPLSFIFSGIHIFKGYRRSISIAIFCLILSPFVLIPTYSIYSAITDYTSNSAKIIKRSNDFRGLERLNLDPEYRAYGTFKGCIRAEGGFLYDVPYDKFVKLLIRKFGYMKGVYLGPYPSRKECFEFIENCSMIIDINGLLADPSLIGLPETVDRVFLNRDSIFLKRHDVLKWGNINDQSVIVGNLKTVSLFDKNTGRKYATYFSFYNSFEKI